MENKQEQVSPRVLVVDDEPNILLSLEFLMKKKGYEVFIARNGAEALDLINAHRPDIIVLDIMMPEVDGYEVCTYVKQNPDLSHIRIIFLTAKSKEADVEKGYKAGADLYMTKPFSTRDLMQRISDFSIEKP
jgi:CheY-like chemotaxis protein